MVPNDTVIERFTVLTKGGLLMFSRLYDVISFSSAILSRVQPLCAREISCFIAVRNPWGLKKPVIQNCDGVSPNSQESICSWRFNSSLNQKPIVDDVQEILNQCNGIRPSYKKSKVSAKVWNRSFDFNYELFFGI